MEQQRYLVDTNAIIDFLAERLPLKGMNLIKSVIDDIPNVSIISKIEVLGLMHLNKNINFCLIL